MLQGRRHAPGQGHIIHERYITVADPLDVSLGSTALGDRFRGFLHASHDEISHFRVESTKRALEFCRVGYNVGAIASIKHSNRKYRWLVRYIHLPAFDRLQAEHDLRCDDNRIDSRPRPRTMRSTTCHRDMKGIRPGHRGTGAVCDRSDAPRRNNVEAENGLGFRIFQRALLDHQACPAFFARWQSFLGRLEKELHRTWQVVS